MQDLRSQETYTLILKLQESSREYFADLIIFQLIYISI